jgi:hypothetical protein
LEGEIVLVLTENILPVNNSEGNVFPVGKETPAQLFQQFKTRDFVKHIIRTGP